MTTTRCADVVSVPDMVARGLDRVRALQRRVARERDAGSASYAVALSRLAELHRREARWWEVLADWVYSSHAGSTPLVFGRAVLAARTLALDYAREYDEFAASARRRAALDGVGVVA